MTQSPKAKDYAEIVVIATGFVLRTHLAWSHFFDRQTGLIAGVLTAIWPSEIAYVTILGSELPFTFLVMLFGPRRSNFYRALTIGLEFGGASYARKLISNGAATLGP